MTTAVDTRIPSGGAAASDGRAPKVGPRRRLFAKYAFALVGLVSLVLLVNGLLNVWFSYHEASDAAIRLQREKADAAAQRIEEFIAEIEKQIGWTTATQWASSPIDQRRFDYGRLQRQVPAITELIQLDSQGREQLKVSRLAMDVQSSGADYSADPAFTEALAKKVWFGPVYFRKESEPYMTMAVAQSGRNAGVTVAEVNLKLIWDVITAIKIGKSGYAYVVDGDGRLIAHPDISRVLRNTDLSTLPQVAAARGPVGTEAQSAAIVHNLDGHRVLSASAAIPKLGWLVFVEQPISEALAPLYTTVLNTGLLLLLGLVVALLAGLLLARRMTVPIRELDAGAARIGAGALDHRITVQTGDELEELAKRFNTMAADLQSSYADLEKKVEDRTAELTEALDQQTATAEVLGVINSSPGDLPPVFDAMLEKAMRLCEAQFGFLTRFDGEAFHAAAMRGVPAAFAESWRREPRRPGPGISLYRLIQGEDLVHIPDITAEDSYRAGNPIRRALADMGCARTGLWVALRKDAALLGAFVIYRKEVRPFSEKQIALLQNFAAQAVIAMENARLITETREALDQQTATAEVLRTIANSPAEAERALDTIAQVTGRLFGASSVNIRRLDGNILRYAASFGSGAAEFRAAVPEAPLDPNSLPGCAILEKRQISVDDTHDPAVRERFPSVLSAGNSRTRVATPLLREGEAIGAIVTSRAEVRAFTEKELTQLTNFADQAVIAMENARLITETHEALEQQTATAEVLQVINSSPGNLAPVFDAMLEKAVRLCEASFGGLTRVDGARFHAVGMHNVPPAFAEAMRQPRPIVPGHAHYRLLNGEDVVQVEDVTTEDIYRSGDPSRHALADLGGARTVLWAALRKDNTLLGAFVIYRQEVRRFTDKQIALLQNFAAQAVIAMENARLITETREALEQQTATAEVLGVINSSPGDLAPVFQSIVEKAHTLCGAACGSLQLWDGEKFRGVAMRGFSDAMVEQLRAGYSPSDMPCQRLVEGERVVHCVDLAEIDSPVAREGGVKLGGVRTILYVALRKDDILLGQIVAARQEVRPFSEKEIALVESFAAQAVIAMENARLITETHEALEQQTATAEVLGVINSSPGYLAPVFDAMLEKAMHLCGAAFGILWTHDGDHFRPTAHRGLPTRFAEFLEHDPPAPEANPRSGHARILAGERLIHVADGADEELYRAGDPYRRALVDLGGARTGLMVPLHKDETVIGCFMIYRKVVRPFSEKQIALLQNFAAQAVIAMENARLITETREALEQQTATAEVLGVINSSPGDLAPVFDAMLDRALHLCEAAFGVLWTYSDGILRPTAHRGVPAPYAEYLTGEIPAAGAGTGRARLLAGESFVHTADLADDEPYRAGEPHRRAVVDLGGARTALLAPLRRDEAVIGVILIYRQEVRPFSDKQIALLQNFAAQAVIAMENARLITETREALEQQTATAEVLGVINSSPGDLAPVFDAMLEKAMGLCGAAFGMLQRYDGERFEATAVRGLPPAYAEFLRSDPPRSGPGTAPARILAGEQIVHIHDLKEEDAYRNGDPRRCAMVDLGGARTSMAVALRKEGTLLGTFTVFRQEVRPFSEKQIALLQNFAAQAVIAMENARLITETREALEQQTATAEVLQVINSSPGDLAPVFDAILEKAHTLCDSGHGSLFLCDADYYFRPAAMRGVPPLLAERLSQGFPGSGIPATQPLLAGKPYVHIHDMAEIDHPMARLAVQSGARTLLSIPLRKGVELFGIIVAARFEVRPFSDKEIALLQNFAAQAVIAIENARLITETREALEQQTATADVLQVINSSPGDLTPVFDAMLERARALCEAPYGNFMIRKGERFHAVSMCSPAPFAEIVQRGFEPHPKSPIGRLISGEPLIHIPDLAEVAPLVPDDPVPRSAVELGGVRTSLMVPLRKDGSLLGAFTLWRQEVRPFTDKQIALLQSFAAQAVIAMENVRLIAELRQRTHDLQESLEYQTATSDVLKVISRSGAELGPVLDTLVETAARICRADSGFIFRLQDGLCRMAASFGIPGEYKEFQGRNPITPGRGTLAGRTVLERRAVHIEDAAADLEYTRAQAVQLGRQRTMLGVPLIREDALIGVITLARSYVEPFTEKQIGLVSTFADQAVIAIENARLLNDLQGRTRDLEESLEYLTATSDVLKVISQSGAELQPVLQTLVETATRICEADNALVLRLRDGRYHIAASVGYSPEFIEHHTHSPTEPGRGTVTGRVAIERRVVHIEDAAADPEYTATKSQQLGQMRTMLGVPLFREDKVAGVIVLSRSRVEPFTEKQVALVTTFADQAVIAIENARLFNELRARTTELGSSVAELKMLNDVAQAVSSTLDLRSVLSTILTSSLGVTWANAGAIFRYARAERAFQLVESVGWDEALARSVRDLRVPENESAMGEAVARRAPVQLDLAQRAAYAPLRDVTLAAGYHSSLIVPLVGAERTLGAIILMRKEAGEFPPETVRVMQTLASQSVLAIQNARMFREIADKSEQLALASQHKSQFLANMSHELRTPLNAILGYAELLVDGIYGVLPDRPKGVLERIQNNGKHLLALINDVLDLAKIEAGQLTLTLEDYALPEVVRSVVTAAEPLATSKGLKFTAAVQDNMPMGHGDARRVSQVLLNLVGNAIKFTEAGEVEIRASSANGQFELTVRDTGPGIADADQERIFGEFQQIDNTNTRNKGGTGLGLAISKRMVEMQGGTISVESALGQGSTFRVVLPVHVDEMMEAAE